MSKGLEFFKGFYDSFNVFVVDDVFYFFFYEFCFFYYFGNDFIVGINDFNRSLYWFFY